MRPYSVPKVIFGMLQTPRNTRRQENRPDKRTKVRLGAIDAVSKNAFSKTFSGSANSIYFVIIASINYIGIFAVRGFIGSLRGHTKNVSP